MRLHEKSPLHRPSYWFCSLLLLLGLAACYEDGEVSIETDTEPLFFETIGMGQMAAFTDTTEIIIRDADHWAEVQAQLRPLRDFPAVDFEQMMVLLVAVPVNTGGYSVQFESVEYDDATITATYMLTIPDDDCITITALAVPFQAVQVRRVEGEAQFARETELFRCEMR